MGWGKEIEHQRSKAAPRLDAARQKAAAAAGSAHSKSKLVKVLPSKAERKGLSTLGVVGLAGALVGIRLCLRYRQQIRETLRRLAKGGGGAREGGVLGSSFRFPGAGRKAAVVKADKGSSKSKAGGGTPVAGAARDATSSSLPRNKVSNNKKNKERKKDKKEAKEVKKMQAEIDADFEAKYGPTRKANTTVVATNQVPADEDMVGGAAGKTFTTHQTMKVSTGYAKIRETVGKD